MENGLGRRINRILGGMQSKNVRIVCLIISVIFVILMFLPWLHLKIEIADASSTYSVECRFSMFEIKRTCLKVIDSLAGSFELFGMSAESILEFIPLVKIIAVFIELIHALIAFFVFLFGAGGFFSIRVRSMFLKPCGTALLIETYSVAVIGIFVGLYLRDMMRYINSDLSFSLSIVFGTEIWLIIELLLSAAFVLWLVPIMNSGGAITSNQ